MLKFMMGGCLTLVVLLGAGGLMAWRWWDTEGRAAAADATRGVFHKSIDESKLSSSDKKKVLLRVDALTDEFKAGRLGTDQLTALVEALGRSGVLEAAGMEAWVDEMTDGTKGVLKDPGKRAAAQKTIQRYVRALVDGKLDEETKKDIQAALMEKDPQGGEKWKENLSAEDVEKALARMAAAADKAHVPAQPTRVDYVAELTAIIDKVLAKPAR
jgi:hypothetical protein